MKILQLCHKMPCPLQDGGAYSIYHTALGLIFQNAQVKVLAINTPKSKVDPNCIPLDFRMKTSFESLPADTRFKPFNAMVNLFTCQSYFVERFYSDEFNAGLIQILLREEFDIVQLEHIYMCLYLGTIRKRSTAKVILRPQNVENQVWQRCQGYVTNPVKRTYMRMATTRLLMYEMDMANDVDGIMAISAADAGTFRFDGVTDNVGAAPAAVNEATMPIAAWGVQT